MLDDTSNRLDTVHTSSADKHKNRPVYDSIAALA